MLEAISAFFRPPARRNLAHEKRRAVKPVEDDLKGTFFQDFRSKISAVRFVQRRRVFSVVA
jgi:hypothetical protein